MKIKRSRSNGRILAQFLYSSEYYVSLSFPESESHTDKEILEMVEKRLENLI